MVAVAYRRWSFTGASNLKALTGKVLVFSIGGRLWEVVAPRADPEFFLGGVHSSLALLKHQ